ncbi:hypothetical protein CXG81DRAFT_13053 [Caulochytrium protostelioides]|uniref:1-acyl-sn-glycerol-3-phosphate acyltransferase n=1 Tax=Caulochytrium protostelioides TaxID=1555241 RepID=A0A4P9X5Y8_9FUNG|nr:1-acylglycerol-3-phosphate O [Caulochytrium protostelioides]RKP00574.1 hypothetical protein CXG81DRAFT_13053 [Caulochytrium protostelioides]|eukprot:RKP00574.1 hypothetical protein CXG81DRAFT_13053 [Caulochytrium protostelioides]
MRYYLRSALMAALLLGMSVNGVLIALVCNLRGKAEMTNYYVGRTCAFLGSYLLGVEYDVINEHLLELSHPAVVICNHQATLDVVSMGRIMPKGVVVMGKKSLRWVPFLGQFMLLGGAVFIDRKDRKGALETMAYVSRILRAEKKSIFIFPEGTRSRQLTNDLLPFKKGAFYLALEGQYPIVPIVVSTYHQVYSSRLRLFEGGKLVIKVLDPIPTKGRAPADVNDLIDEVHAAMSKALREISGPPSPEARLVGSAARPDAVKQE